MKTESNCASDGSVTLANGFFGVGLYQLGTCFGDIFKLYLARNCFLYLFTYLLFHYDRMFTAVCKLEVSCE